jgi:hypothetical protein
VAVPLKLEEVLPPNLAKTFVDLAKPVAVEEAVPVAETGTDVYLRLDFSGNQVEAVLADSYSAAGLVVVDFVADGGSCLVDGSRVRSRFPEGQTMLLANVLRTVVGGNIVSNEVPEAATPVGAAIRKPPRPTPSPTPTPTPTPAPEQAPPGSYSIVVWPQVSPTKIAEVAVMGNVFVDWVILPLRPLPAPFNTWWWLNTIVNFAPGA